MPQDTNNHAVPSAPAAGWMATTQRHAGSIGRWLKQTSKAASGQDWTASKSSRQARRPVWE